MTTEQTALQRLKEMCEKATPGPWRLEIEERCDEDNRIVCRDTIFSNAGHVLTTSPYQGLSEEDSALIVTARQALPILIDLCEALEKQEQARGIMDKNEIRYDPCCFYQSQKDYKDATTAVEAAKARLEDVCPKK